MQNLEMSLIGKLDNGLTKGLSLLLGWLKTAFIWLSGLILLISLPIIIFEYGEGSADLSPVEWIFMPLMLLLLWRHVHYCKYFGTGFWRGFSRLVMYQGLLVMIGLVLIGLVANILVMEQSVNTAGEDLREFIRVLMMDDPETKILRFGVILFATYLATPSKCKLTRPVAAVVPAEPVYQAETDPTKVSNPEAQP